MTENRLNYVIKLEIVYVGVYADKQRNTEIRFFLSKARTVQTICCKTESNRNIAFKTLQCNIYAVQQDTQSVLMSEFIHHVC